MPQSYVNNIEAGHAMLDAARAARQLGAASPTTPIGFWGYSQGGAAAVLGATLHSSYAPDVNLKGVYAGAPPLGLAEVADMVDGGVVAGVLGFAINGYVHRYPEGRPLIDELMNECGKATLAKLAQECIIASVPTAAFRHTSEYTKSGESFGRLFRTNAFMKRILDEQVNAAYRAPDVPMMVLSNRYDDVVAYPQVRSAVHAWMRQGATITFVSLMVGPFPKGGAVGHFLPSLDALPVALKYMEARLSGELITVSSTVDIHGQHIDDLAL